MSTANTNQANENATRDAKGRFAPGNPGGPGNPFARQVAELRKAIVHAAKPELIERVIAKMGELGAEGNVQAAKLFLAYSVGKPKPAPEPDRMDAEEWHGYQE